MSFRKALYEQIWDTWIAFNGPALWTLAFGGIVWRQIRKLIKRKLEEKDSV